MSDPGPRTQTPPRGKRSPRIFFAGFLSGVGVVALGALVFGWIWLRSAPTPELGERLEAPSSSTAAPPDALAHAEIFRRQTSEVIPGVHLAVGYGLANVVVVDAPDGLILIDTLESIRAAQQLLPWVDELRRSTGKDITDIVYTHNHADHVFGAGIFVQNQATAPRVWAHRATEDRVYEIVNVLSPITFQRAMRMFGVYLADEDFTHNGIGGRLVNDHRDGLHFLPPTDEIDEEARVELAGEEVILRHAPGETADQILLFFPERSLLLPADNYYHAFPNLYTVRGTPYRDPRPWAQSLDVMRGYGAEVMIPQHSLPVLGAEEIDHRLLTYRDAIQFVFDETIRLINAGKTPAEIAEEIELPAHLASEPHLQEMYGRVEFAAKAIFSGTLGWFSGDPADLRPVAQQREAELLSRLAGGPDRIAAEAEQALADGEAAWALTLGTHLERLGDTRAPELRARALKDLAADETASSVRNYYLTAAAEAEGFELPQSGLSATPVEVVDRIPIRHFLNVMATNLDHRRTHELELTYGFDFTDAEPVSLRIRRGVALIEEGLAPDRVGTLRTSTSDFRGLITGRLDPARLLVSRKIAVDGGVEKLRAFLGYFGPRG